jgi:hypothetical protein
MTTHATHAIHERLPMTVSTRLFLTLLALAAVALVAAGCGGSQKAAASDDDRNFQCKDRRIAYIVTGSFAGPEVGVVVDCAERGPRIMKWQVVGVTGDKQTMAHSLTTGEFHELWQRIESTGWRHLSNCNNPEAVDGDPKYKIGIQDESLSVSLDCDGKELPFPYDRIVNELDLKAAEYSN